RWQRHPAGLLTANQIAADRNQGLAALGPQRGDDVGSARTPIEAGQDWPLYVKRIHERDDIDGDRRGLTLAAGVGGKKSRRAVAADEGHDHAITDRRQSRRDIDKTVNVIWPAVQQKHGRTAGRAGLGIADAEDTGIDLPERRE